MRVCMCLININSGKVYTWIAQQHKNSIIIRHTPDQESLATGVSTVLFWPIQQELDCVSDSGQVVGKIKFDGAKNEYAFCPMDEALVLSAEQERAIVERLAGLASGKYLIPMQDDD